MAMPAMRREEVPEPQRALAAGAWPVSWSGAWAGALAAVAVTLVAGLIGLAVGAHQVSQGDVPTFRQANFWSLAWSVAGAFFAFVAGGWVAGKICGAARSEVCALHGAIAWLVAVPLLLLLMTSGAAAYLGSWYGGLAWIADAAAAGARSAEELARAVRNAALGGVTALLLGLAGAVVGGWLASGEPMSIRYRRADSA
ncbi:MAG: hypothetical protein ACE147_11540 [Candidatus Methylomirabilales bacterium]